METTTNASFKRKQRLGINPMSCNEKNPTALIDITSDTIELFTKKDGDTIEFVSATNMETGEDVTFWVGGQVRHQLEQMLKNRKTLKGLKLEIQWKGFAEADVVVDGKMTTKEVNQYDIFELE